MNIIALVDTLTTIGFFICILVILRIKNNQLDDVSKGFYLTSVTLFFLISVSNILEHGNITTMFDVFEDYLEILFIPFIFFSTITYIYMREISKRRQIQNELIFAKEKAEENDRLKSRFLANLSHEIRTPMNSIVGFTNLLEIENLSKDSQQKYLQIIKSSSSQLLNLITDILDISKIEANQLDIHCSIVDLEKLMNELYTRYNYELAEYPEKNLKIEVNIRETTISKIICDQTRLNQVFSNLLNNAIKFTQNGKIEFGYSEYSDKLRFFVSDTGIGISDEFKKQIFSRFSREKISSDTLYGGTGLGLAISKGLVNLMGGEIYVESEKNAGSTFYFTLPVEPVK
ncbi:MAG: hypothetical protein A2X13_08375 [Bacteroidetes bacterium GWC2_33_15]|nr:MAG: hypothetical protein A2X10_10205 [Bacteroidetes bacterium GWA2_33_15]OFX51469.1 MAG: hypothetical protein A2X13_08375 [Bacteroidetes bacterium GWC2_33_15]OFX65784.1 MAG: hypothetical protein A2X15_13400 [Bacteroidetes bacterium GWB2_32_14]OFX69497.1 MAG: hypothetical protein A2X14_09955 [Bacteroidetes bacterium GWD2_33_33]HAN17755.1 hypothetical protein [Bacteroidales bacterium]